MIDRRRAEEENHDVRPLFQIVVKHFPPLNRFSHIRIRNACSHRSLRLHRPIIAERLHLQLSDHCLFKVNWTSMQDRWSRCLLSFSVWQIYRLVKLITSVRTSRGASNEFNLCICWRAAHLPSLTWTISDLSLLAYRNRKMSRRRPNHRNVFFFFFVSSRQMRFFFSLRNQRQKRLMPFPDMNRFLSTSHKLHHHDSTSKSGADAGAKKHDFHAYLCR